MGESNSLVFSLSSSCNYDHRLANITLDNSSSKQHDTWKNQVALDHQMLDPMARKPPDA